LITRYADKCQLKLSECRGNPFNLQSVLEYPTIKGVAGNVLFFHHEHAEASAGEDDEGKVNPFEVNMSVALARHLIMNGYSSSQVSGPLLLALPYSMRAGTISIRR
jgi:hypothetical protein